MPKFIFDNEIGLSLDKARIIMHSIIVMVAFSGIDKSAEPTQLSR